MYCSLGDDETGFFGGVMAGLNRRALRKLRQTALTYSAKARRGHLRRDEAVQSLAALWTDALAAAEGTDALDILEAARAQTIWWTGPLERQFADPKDHKNFLVFADAVSAAVPPSQARVMLSSKRTRDIALSTANAIGALVAAWALVRYFRGGWAEGLIAWLGLLASLLTIVALTVEYGSKAIKATRRLRHARVLAARRSPGRLAAELTPFADTPQFKWITAFIIPVLTTAIVVGLEIYSIRARSAQVEPQTERVARAQVSITPETAETQFIELIEGSRDTLWIDAQRALYVLLIDATPSTPGSATLEVRAVGAKLPERVTLQQMRPVVYFNPVDGEPDYRLELSDVDDDGWRVGVDVTPIP